MERKQAAVLIFILLLSVVLVSGCTSSGDDNGDSGDVEMDETYQGETLSLLAPYLLEPTPLDEV